MTKTLWYLKPDSFVTTLTQQMFTMLGQVRD